MCILAKQAVGWHRHDVQVPSGQLHILQSLGNKARELNIVLPYHRTFTATYSPLAPLKFMEEDFTLPWYGRIFQLGDYLNITSCTLWSICFYYIYYSNKAYRGKKLLVWHRLQDSKQSRIKLYKAPPSHPNTLYRKAQRASVASYKLRARSKPRAASPAGRTEMKQKLSIPIEDAKGRTGGQSNLHSKVAYNINLTLF